MIAGEHSGLSLELEAPLEAAARQFSKTVQSLSRTLLRASPLTKSEKDSIMQCLHHHYLEIAEYHKQL